jgi:hypothetical protein
MLPQNYDLSFKASFGASPFVNSNTWHLSGNNFNLNFMWYCMLICVCVFLLRRESPNMILGDKPLISKVVLSQKKMKIIMKVLDQVRRVRKLRNLEVL